MNFAKYITTLLILALVLTFNYKFVYADKTPCNKVIFVYNISNPKNIEMREKKDYKSLPILTICTIILLVIIAYFLPSKKGMNYYLGRNLDNNQPLNYPILRDLNGHIAKNPIEIKYDSFKIGRDYNVCSLIFPKDLTEISFVHCEIKWDRSKNKIYIIDKSTNGTYFMNGTRLETNKVYELKPKEKFYIVDNKNMFQIEF